MKTFIIHYTRMSERKIAIQSQLVTNGLRAEYIEDFDGDDLTSENISKYYDPSPALWESTIGISKAVFVENSQFHEYKKSWSENIVESDISWLNFRKLSPGLISCGIKHFLAYEKIVINDLEYALIIEDDSIFDEKFATKVTKAIRRLPEKWDFLFLGDGCNFRAPGRRWYKSLYYMDPPRSKSTDCYLISNRAARILLEKGKPFALPIGWLIQSIMQRENLICYWCDPPLSIQGSQSGVTRPSTNASTPG